MNQVARDPQLLKGVLHMLVLQVLSDDETYGYQLVTRLDERGLANISTGSVYPVLSRLERDGLLTSRLVASNAGPARKYYRPTPTGMETLVDAIRAWDELTETVHAVMRPNQVPPKPGRDDEQSSAGEPTRKEDNR